MQFGTTGCLTGPQQVTFRAAEYNEFVVTINCGLTPGAVLSGTPPSVLNEQTYNLAFSAPLIGAQNVLSNCQNYTSPLTLRVSSYPIFPSSAYLIALPGVPVPSDNFQMGASFNSISMNGTPPLASASIPYPMPAALAGLSTASQIFDFIRGRSTAGRRIQDLQSDRQSARESVD